MRERAPSVERGTWVPTDARNLVEKKSPTAYPGSGRNLTQPFRQYAMASIESNAEPVRSCAELCVLRMQFMTWAQRGNCNARDL